MTFDHLANLMLGWGFEIKEEHYFQFENYLKEMLRRKRVMVVQNGPMIEAVILYYLTNNYSKLYKKSTWQLIKDDPDGHQLYVDKMICRKWTKSVREAVQSAIQERFPNVTEAYYHRAPKDRCVKIKRRSKYELQSTVY